MNRLILFLLCFNAAFATIAIQQAKVGETVEIDLGDFVKTWQRAIGGKTETVVPSNRVKILPNGHLVITKVQPSDAGQYSSPELKPKVTKHEDGSVSAVAAPVIRLEVSQ